MTYQVLSQTPTLPSETAPRMDDYSEAQRWAAANQALIGLGEESYDPDAQDALRAFGPYGN